MIIKLFGDYEALSEAAARMVISCVENKPTAVLCLAAGDTPRRAYSRLVEFAETRKTDFSQCTFVGLDEWVGIPPDNEGSCAYFLKTNLFTPLRIAPSQLHLFNALSPDHSSECTRMNATIREKGGIDLMLVGVGMNGHIGFNEPGTPTNLYAHLVELDATTQSVGQKYFRKSTKLQNGITLGLKHVLESRLVVVMASGKKKADVIRLALEGPITTQVPASVIRQHPEGVVMLDQEAAEGLKG